MSQKSWFDRIWVPLWRTILCRASVQWQAWLQIRLQRNGRSRNSAQQSSCCWWKSAKNLNYLVCSRWENGYYNYINKQNIKKKHEENEINYLAADSHVEGWNERV